MSDNEEDEEDYPDTTFERNQLTDESVLGKRPRIEPTATAIPSTLLIEQDRIPLSEKSCAHRRISGRVPKRIRREEDLYEYQKL